MSFLPVPTIFRFVWKQKKIGKPSFMHSQEPMVLSSDEEYKIGLRSFDLIPFLFKCCLLARTMGFQKKVANDFE
jgi:hypothetical protein